MNTPILCSLQELLLLKSKRPDDVQAAWQHIPGPEHVLIVLINAQ